MLKSVTLLNSLRTRNKVGYCIYRYLSSSLLQKCSSERTTHFGFETIPENLKTERVKDVFTSVASKYDLMNDVMSLGIHRLWKDKFISVLNPVPEMKLLDMAGGTGDIAFRFLHYIETNSSSEQVHDDALHISDPLCETVDGVPEENSSISGHHVTICDINQEMLDAGKTRQFADLYKKRISWVQADAEDLPFGNNSFDAYTIAFGIRNTVHIDKVLAEAYRVLNPGGRFLCLEFSEVTGAPLKKLYDTYSFQVIPVLGQVFARDWHSYQYLVESIRKFPPQEKFQSMIEEAGFNMVSYTNMSSGIVAIHSGFKI